MNWIRKNKHRIEDDCCAQRLSAYLDCELSAEERAAVERHLAKCEGCCWDLETLRQTVEWTRNCAPVRVPRAFTLPVEAAAPQAVRARRPAWGLPFLQGATALVALLFVVVVVGDLSLGGATPRSAPQMVALQATAEMDQAVAVQAVEVTRAVVVEVVETVAVEAAVEMPTSEPAAAKALSPEATAIPPSAPEALTMVAPEPTLAGEAGGVGAGEPSGLSVTMAVLAVEVEPSASLSKAAATSTATATLAFTAVAPSPTLPLTVEVALTASMTSEQASERAPSATATASMTAYSAATAVPTEHLAPAPTAEPAVEMPAPAPVDTADSGTEPGAEAVAVTEGMTDAAAPTEAPVALSSGPGPTAIAAVPEVREAEQGARTGEEQGVVGTLVETVAPWFNTAEIVLGAAFVLLALATAVAMLRWQPR